MEILVENSKTNIINLKEVWLSEGNDLIFKTKTLAKELDENEKTIAELINKNNGKISENGSIHFKNVESVVKFENEIENKYSDVLVMKKMCSEDVPIFDYNNYEKPGIWNIFESAWIVIILFVLTFIIVSTAYMLK